MATIRLSVTPNNRSLRAELGELTRDTWVATRVIGPSVDTGWPEVEFKGLREQLETVVRRYDGDGPHVDALLALIVDEPAAQLAQRVTA